MKPDTKTVRDLYEIALCLTELGNNRWKEGPKEELRQFVKKITTFGNMFAQGIIEPNLVIRDLYEIAISLSEWGSEGLEADQVETIEAYVDRIVKIARDLADSGGD